MIGCTETITVYNKIRHPENSSITWHRTVLHGASWSETRVVNADTGGLNAADEFSVRVRDNGNYVDTYTFSKLAELGDHWTAQNGDLVALGDVGDITAASDLQGVASFFRVTGWRDNRHGSVPGMKHIRFLGG